MSDVAEKVKAIIIDNLGVDAAEVTNEASFTNDLGADSLDTVELIWSSKRSLTFKFQTIRRKLLQLLVMQFLLLRQRKLN